MRISQFQELRRQIERRRDAAVILQRIHSGKPTRIHADWDDNFGVSTAVIGPESQLAEHRCRHCEGVIALAEASIRALGVEIDADALAGFGDDEEDDDGDEGLPS